MNHYYIGAVLFSYFVLPLKIKTFSISTEKYPNYRLEIPLEL